MRSREFAIFALDCEGGILANRIAAAVGAATQGMSAAATATTRALSVGLSIGIADVKVGEEFDALISRALNALPGKKHARRQLARSGA